MFIFALIYDVSIILVFDLLINVDIIHFTLLSELLNLKDCCPHKLKRLSNIPKQKFKMCLKNN